MNLVDHLKTHMLAHVLSTRESKTRQLVRVSIITRHYDVRFRRIGIRKRIYTSHDISVYFDYKPPGALQTGSHKSVDCNLPNAHIVA